MAENNLSRRAAASGAKAHRATIRDVAREANVSISTVSRYLNETGCVEHNTAARIALAIERLHYVPSIAAQSLRSRASRIVLLVVPDICNPFYSQIAKTAQRLLRENGYVMTLYDSNESTQELASIRIARQMYASGILLGSIDVKEQVIQEIITSKIPVVGLNAFQEYPFDTVHVHGTEGTYLAVHHLIALGHRHIGFAGGSSNTMIGDSRLEGSSFENFGYFTVTEGTYLDVSGGRFTAAENAPIPQPEDGVYPAGMYRVGRDLPAGEYLLTPNQDYSAHYEILDSSQGGYEHQLDSGWSDGELSFRVEEGQYLNLSFGTFRANP